MEGDHEAIIPPRTFKRVQHEIERRKSCHATGGTIFSGKIVCGQCGQIYGPKVWHPKDKYRRVIWQCNDKYRKNGTPRCKTPHLTEEQVKETFLKVCARIYSEKDEIIDNLRMLLSAVEDTAAMQAEADRLSGELDVISEMLQREIDQNARVAQDQDAYTQRFTELSARFAEVQAAKDKTDAAIAEKESKGLQIRTFIEAIEELPADLTEFRSDLWADLVETATVQQDNTIRLPAVLWAGNHGADWIRTDRLRGRNPRSFFSFCHGLFTGFMYNSPVAPVGAANRNFTVSKECVKLYDCIISDLLNFYNHLYLPAIYGIIF